MSLIAEFELLVVSAFKYIFYNVNSWGDNKKTLSVSTSVSMFISGVIVTKLCSKIAL